MSSETKEGEPHGPEPHQYTEKLRTDLDKAHQLGKQLSRELENVGEQLGLIANLYVQLRRIHGSLKLIDVVTAVNETLINLVGTEEFGLFLRNPETTRFELLSTTGAAARELPSFGLGEGPCGSAAASGQILFGNGLAAVIPLRSGLYAGSAGVIAIVHLLKHKRELTSQDRALLEVFAEHAGVALEAAMCASGKPKFDVTQLCAQLTAPIVAPLLSVGKGTTGE